MELFFIEGSRFIPGIYLSLQDEATKYFNGDGTGFHVQLWRLELSVSFPWHNRLIQQKQRLNRIFYLDS